MDLRQSNVFGDNIINVEKGDRKATPELADDLAQQLQGMGARAVAIHFEHDGETAEFVKKLALLLNERLPVVGVHARAMSGIQRNTLTIAPPTDGETGYLRIGTQ